MGKYKQSLKEKNLINYSVPLNVPLIVPLIFTNKGKNIYFTMKLISIKKA